MIKFFSIKGNYNTILETMLFLLKNCHSYWKIIQYVKLGKVRRTPLMQNTFCLSIYRELIVN